MFTTEAAMKQIYFPSDDAREKLVLAVQEYPCLWDSSLDYRGKGKGFS